MEALPPAPEPYDEAFIAFAELWERGQELASVLARLPSALILKSGLAARRKSLLERWGSIEEPSIDGSMADDAVPTMRKWNHDAEVLISYVIKVGREYESPFRGQDGMIYSGPPVDPESLPQVIDSIDEADSVDDYWCWPWEQKAIAEQPKKKWYENRATVTKIGVAAGLGLLALVVYMDEGD